jgi:hypothetical protein
MVDYAKGICPYCCTEFELFVKERSESGRYAYIEISHLVSCNLSLDEAVSIVHKEKNMRRP